MDKAHDRGATRLMAINVILSAVYTVALVSIFMLGAIMLWGLGIFFLIGILLMLYSTVSCFMLIKTWSRPEAKIISTEKVCDILCYAILLAAIAQADVEREMKVNLWIGGTFVIGAKWLSISRLYRNRIFSLTSQ